MIVGDDTRTRARYGRPEPRHRTPPQRSPDPGKGPGAHTAKRRSEGRVEQAADRHAMSPVNAGSDPDAPTTPYGRVLAMIIRMRLRAGAAIPGRSSTHPPCPPIAVHGSSVMRPQPGRGGARDLHPALRPPKALLRAESRSRVTYDHPRSPTLRRRPARTSANQPQTARRGPGALDVRRLLLVDLSVSDVGRHRGGGRSRRRARDAAPGRARR